MGLIADITGVVDVESQARRPLVGFLAEDRLTQGRFNVFLVTFGPLLFVAGLVTGEWGYAVVGAIFIVWAVLCYRWYRARLSAALADPEARRALEAGR